MLIQLLARFSLAHPLADSTSRQAETRYCFAADREGSGREKITGWLRHDRARVPKRN